MAAQRVLNRVLKEFFDTRLIDNNLRGNLAEAMVADQLGEPWRIVSGGWHAWDIQFGPDDASYPERIRLQVKNAAAVQTWHHEDSAPSKPKFTLSYRPRPYYWDRDANTPCEDLGFLCDAYVLCLHGETRKEQVDHRDLEQWQVYLLPVVGPNNAVTSSEFDWMNKKARTSRNGRSSTERTASTLSKGIRGRPKIAPIPMKELTDEKVRQALGLPT